MRIGTNITAYMAGSRLQKVEKDLSRSMERLSSGYKINVSKDDPAGMAMTQKLRTQIKELKRSGMNASDGISVIQTAESALSEVTLMLQRMRELSVQGASDSSTDEDRKNIMSEITELQKEINRVSSDTQFNNQNLLDGTFERCNYAFDENNRLTTDVSVLYVSESVSAGKYELNIVGGKIDVDDAQIKKVFGQNAIATVDGNKVDITGDNGFEMSFALNNENMADQTVTIELYDFGSMPVQIGNNEGQSVGVIIPKISAEVFHIDDLDCTTAKGCGKAITKLDKAISLASKIRSSLGAYQNRLDSAALSIDAVTDSLTKALSTISDTNMAEEMTEYTSQSVLQQAGITMLTQANQMPEKTLQLLQ